jgi:cytidylate kinase
MVLWRKLPPPAVELRHAAVLPGTPGWEEDCVSIITISRGTFSGGKALAESLRRRLGYRCIDRDLIVERAAGQRASQHELRAALEESPSLLGRFSHKRYLYLTLIQSALTEELRAGSAIYHGLTGHLLLREARGILRLRVIAPLEFRIRMARERLNISRSEAIAHIEKMDQDRRKWAQFLYGVDWADPALYDMVVNLEQVTIEQAGTTVAALIENGCCEYTPECRESMDALALASRVKAALALSPSTSNLEVEVHAQGASVRVSGAFFEEVEDVERVVRGVRGVSEVSLEELTPADQT